MQFYGKLTQLLRVWLSYTHINPFFKCYFSLWFIPGDWIQFLLLYSRTLLILNVMFEIYQTLYFTHQFKTNNSHDSWEFRFSRGPISHYTFPERKKFPEHSPWRKTEIACVCLCRKYLDETQEQTYYNRF